MQKNNGITLVMMVKNEMTVLPRAIDSVRHLIRDFVILDTGSTDGTWEYLRTLSRESGIPGRFFRMPWKNFGYNRTELLRIANKWAKGSWLLLLDADMVVEGDFSGLKDVTDDIAMIRIMDDQIYRMPLLIRKDKGWYYTGVTHEYLTSRTQKKTFNFDNLSIIHHADGSRRPDKFTNDIELLREELGRQFTHRNAFYLAESFKNIGDDLMAIIWYRLAAKDNPFLEEGFYAQMQLALAEHRRNSYDGFDAMLTAWKMRMHRAEPLYYLALWHRHKGEFEMTALYITYAAKLDQALCRFDVLWVDSWIYNWGVAYEWSLSLSRRTETVDAAKTVAAELLEHGDFTEEYKHYLRVILS